MQNIQSEQYSGQTSASAILVYPTGIFLDAMMRGYVFVLSDWNLPFQGGVYKSKMIVAFQVFATVSDTEILGTSLIVFPSGYLNSQASDS